MHITIDKLEWTTDYQLLGGSQSPFRDCRRNSHLVPASCSLTPHISNEGNENQTASTILFPGLKTEVES